MIDCLSSRLARVRIPLKPKHTDRKKGIGIKIDSKSKVKNPVLATTETGRINSKLEDIIVPSLELQETPLKKGIAIKLNSGIDGQGTKITLKLNDSTLATILDYCCELGGYQYTVEGRTVFITQ